MRFQHLVITRFNLRPWKGSRLDQHLDPDWLAGRLGLFRRYCAPSVVRQTVQDFTWLILIDPRTPEHVRCALRSASPRIELLEPEDADAPFEVTVRERLRREGAEGGPVVHLQSRLDTDDAIAPAYFELLREAVDPERTEFLCFRRGYQLQTRTGAVYGRRWSSNSFMNLAQPPTSNPLMIYDVEHPFVTKVAPLRHLEGRGMWLHVVHDRNVSSHLLDGPPVLAGRVRRRFGLDASVISSRSARGLGSDVARWMAALPVKLSQGDSVRRSVPESLAARQRHRNRRQRLLRVVSAEAFGHPPDDGSVVQSWLEAWDATGRLPGARFLEAMLQADGDIVSCGTGLTTVMLATYLPNRSWVIEPDRERFEQTRTLLDETGLTYFAEDRLQWGGDLERADMPGRCGLLVVNCSPVHDGRPGGYAIVADLVARCQPETVLVDDAHEAARRGLLTEEAPLSRGVITAVETNPKPYLEVSFRAPEANSPG